jgi:sugar phosphate isomerase/epimerase
MIPALFSVSYAGAWGQHRLGVVEFIEKAARLGYPAVELGGKRPHLSVLDYPDEASLLPVRDAARRHKIDIATIAGYTDFTASRHAAEVPFVEMQVHYVAELARIARTLGAKIVRVFSGYFTDLKEFTADWDKCVKALREAAAVAGDFGVFLGVQNHHDVGVSVEAFEELLNDIAHPNAKAMFDPWSPALHGADLYKSARRFAPLMVQTTLADYVKLDRFRYKPELINYERLDPPAAKAVPLGDGFLDLEGFFAGLKEGGFTGYVAYEMCSPVRGGGSEANLDATATKSLNKIRQLIG